MTAPHFGTLFLALLVLVPGCAKLAPSDQGQLELSVQPEVPADIPGGAESASLEDAALFAWQRFIALNWPAVRQTGQRDTRGFANTEAVFGDVSGPVVWETFRSKSEIFPGIGNPHGRQQGADRDYGFDDPPRYVFDPAVVGGYSGLPQGEVPACRQAAAATEIPWVNLSEAHEVGPDSIFVGSLAAGQDSTRRVLYAVKGNRTHYAYVAANGWYDGGNSGSAIPSSSTSSFISTHHRSPPAGSDKYVSFPNGTVEVKSAWRELTEAEAGSGRFRRTVVRRYLRQSPKSDYAGSTGRLDHPCYEDLVWGLVGLHIKLKTPSAPYSVWATFEQADIILDQQGEPVEDRHGEMIRNVDAAATEPLIRARNARAANPASPASIWYLSV